MICYLDTSALVKLYVKEPGSDAVRKLVDEVSDSLIWLAGELAEKHSLRGFDAIHLAAALTLKTQVKSRVVAACFDDRLWEALSAVGIEVVPATKPSLLLSG